MMLTTQDQAVKTIQNLMNVIQYAEILDVLILELTIVSSALKTHMRTIMGVANVTTSGPDSTVANG